MANQPSTTSRRSFLAAAVVAPVIIATPALAAPAFDSAVWIKGFLQLGGAVNIGKDGVRFWYPPEDEIIEYMQEIGREPDKWAAVRAHAESIVA